MKKTAALVSHIHKPLPYHQTPETAFFKDSTESCEPLTVHFINQSQNLSTQVIYEWYFRTGEKNNEQVEKAGVVTVVY